MSTTECLCSRREWIINTYGERSPQYWAYMAEDDGRAVCLLEAGHAGPHEWTPITDVTVEREAEDVT